ncbi:fimbrial protein [Edwardsiella tarda]|uniref:F4 family fimbrial subunit n=1 Tax=Edwardsiella tarda TaxID=636 RepID=UPI00351C1D41
MKTTTLLLLAASLLPSCVWAWNTPGEDFSGELSLRGTVTRMRNPWVWRIGEGDNGLHVQRVTLTRNGEAVIPVPLRAMTLLLGKTMHTTPLGREGLSPRVTYGQGQDGFQLAWTAPGTATITLPVKGADNIRIGSFTFQMLAAAVIRYAEQGRTLYAGLYEDRSGNGVPPQAALMPQEQIAGKLQAMFAGDGPDWLAAIHISGSAGLSRFNDAQLHQIAGVYGAQVIPGSGELRFHGAVPSHWRVSLPVSVEYQ